MTVMECWKVLPPLSFHTGHGVPCEPDFYGEMIALSYCLSCAFMGAWFILLSQMVLCPISCLFLSPRLILKLSPVLFFQMPNLKLLLIALNYFKSVLFHHSRDIC